MVVYIERELLDFAFIEAHPCKEFAIRTPFEVASTTKFFFIYPIGCAIDDFVELAIFSDLKFGVEIKFFDKQVIATSKRNHASIRRELSQVLKTWILA